MRGGGAGMELTDAELDVMVVLCRHLVRADGVFSPEEVEAMHDLEEQVGVARWRAARERTRASCPSVEEAYVFAASAARADARTWMWEALQDIARSDALSPEEDAFFAALSAQWDKPPRRRRSLLGRGPIVGP